MGHACADECLHGKQDPPGSTNCVCEKGWVGTGCDVPCSFNGVIIDTEGNCLCKHGWRGDVCDIPGCEGEGSDCSGHGTCNTATHVCTCHPGWTGSGCNIADCPGNPDCNGRGPCSALVDPPRCIDCADGWMGKACEVPCTHGKQTPANSGICVCEMCYSGKSCNSECTGHGHCRNSVCVCDESWRGEKCEIAGCPGVENDCSKHGECIPSTHTCLCHAGQSYLYL